MSSLIYPTLPGLTYEVIRAPVFKTRRQQALSGKETAISDMVYPRTRFTLIYSLLRDTGAAGGFIGPSEIETLVGFFQQMRGSWDTWLFQDPDFNSVAAQPFGTGDGSTVLFPVTANYAQSGFSVPELIQDFNGQPQFFLAGVPTFAFTLGPTTSINAGYVQFSTPPPPGTPLTWSGNFYYRCRFDEDTYEFIKFMQYLWELKKISFTSVLL
jgi:hypothetical protein